jgi:hypothetical protein
MWGDVTLRTGVVPRSLRGCHVKSRANIYDEHFKEKFSELLREGSRTRPIDLLLVKEVCAQGEDYRVAVGKFSI